MKTIYHAMFKEQFENQSLQKSKISELNQRIEKVEEKFILGDINKELYTKYRGKYTSEIEGIKKQMARIDLGSSNLDKCLDIVVKFCRNPLILWCNGEIRERTLLQNLMFPNGIIYDRENDQVRTPRINSIFALIPEVTKVLKGIKKGETINFDDFSSRVTSEGFKPSTATAVMWYSIQLNYEAIFPIWDVKSKITLSKKERF